MGIFVCFPLARTNERHDIVPNAFLKSIYLTGFMATGQPSCPVTTVAGFLVPYITGTIVQLKNRSMPAIDPLHKTT